MEPKVALLVLGIELILSKNLENPPKIVLVILVTPQIDQYGVNEDHNKLIQIWPENPIHHVYEYRWGISKPEGRHHELVMAITSPKSSPRHILCLNLELEIAGQQINFRIDRQFL